VQIVPVESRAQWRDFLRVPYRVYKDDPNWVPPLLLERRRHLSPKHNPFFQHAEAAFWLAYRDGVPAGRISAQVDRLHLETHADGTGHFGFLEATDDPEIFAALLGTAEEWLRRKGLIRALGPASFSLWHESGVLVEGFDTPPYVMMAHSRPYFSRHIEAAGYAGIQDLIAYSVNAATPLPPTVQRIIARGHEQWGVTVRKMRLERRHLAGEVALILDILNDAWSDNWGFVPMTQAEMDEFTAFLKLFLTEDDVSIAEHSGTPVAFAATFPNLNEAIRDLGGRLLPFGWMKLLWRLKAGRLRSARMPLMGIRKPYHDSNVGAALALTAINSAIASARRRGWTQGELSWVLEQNTRVRHIIEWMGGVPYKRYRLFAKPL
jgi:hypothetical protein